VNHADEARALNDTLALNPLNPKDLLSTFGLVGVWAIMFAETGLMVGFFLPGDSLLFVAGVAASPIAHDFGFSPLPLAGVLIGAPIAAIAGAQLGHYLGARYGPRLFARPDSRFFKREYVERAEYYFEKFGPAKAIVLARFIPIVRTFINPVAGVLEMPARRFFLWNVIGGLIWTEGILLAGYALAARIKSVIPPDKIDNYLLPVVALIVLVSAIPIFIEIIRERRARRRSYSARRDQADRAQAIQAAREEAIGAGLVRVSCYVAVTVTDPADLPTAVAEVEARAGQSKIKLRRLAGSQLAGFCATLPAGVHPAHLAKRGRR
jgi:membrane-associated protein